MLSKSLFNDNSHQLYTYHIKLLNKQEETNPYCTIKKRNK